MFIKRSYDVISVRELEIPGPPGAVVLKLFIPVIKPQTMSVVALKTPCRIAAILKLVLGSTVFVLFACLSLSDAIDIADGGYLRTRYGKFNPILSLMSFCNSTITFLNGAVAALFLLTKKRDIMNSAVVLESLFGLLQGPFDSQPNQFFARTLRRLNYHFILMALFSVFVLVLPFSSPDFFPQFWLIRRYAGMEFPIGVCYLCFRVTAFLCMLVNYAAKCLFAYLCCFLLSCSEIYHTKAEYLLSSMALEKRDASMNEQDLFEEQLEIIRDEDEKISTAFDQLQKTFSLKLLLDVAGCIAGLCNDVAWLSVFVLESGKKGDASLDMSAREVFDNWSLARRLFIIAADVCSLCVVVRSSVKLYYLVSLVQAFLTQQ